MDETQKLYDVLKREGYYTKSFDEFQSQFQDSAYQDKVFGVVSRDGLYTKDKESFLSKYVKKKVGAESSESLAEPTTSGDFEQWEIDMFKGFDENPSSLSTASNIDLRKYNDYKKSIGEDRPLVSAPDQEFLASGEVATPQAPILSQTEKDAQAEKESMLKGLSDDEKTIVGSAIDETNNWYAERGGMTPFVKMQELNRRVNELQSDISAEDISRMTTDEIDALDTKYKQSVLDIANELGLSVKEDGTISPYESEVNEFKDRLDFYTRIADDKQKEEGKASFGQDIMNKLASGYEQASANVLDMVGAVTGLNYFDSYKNLSEGGRYNAEKLRSYANRYDGTIEDYLVNGEIGKAAGLAVGGAMESLPSMLPVFVNPQYGLYVMSGMSGIDKYREIEDKDIPEWSKYYNAFITGASEYAGEKIVTIPILKRSKQAIKSLGEKGGKQAIENALKKSVENNAAKFGRMPEWVAEGMSEVATGISTDIVDKVTIDPNTKIGSHAVDDFVVGALMGKVFALPQDLARGMNTLAARDFSRNVLDKLPSDMNTEDKISLGWKIVERNKLQEAEDKLDDAFKGKYQARIVELNGEIADLSAKYNEMQQPTVGTTEEVGEMQSQLNYLQEQGVKVPDGSTAEDVANLYEETKKSTAEETKPPTAEKATETTEKTTETEEPVSQKEQTFATEPISDEAYTDYVDNNNVSDETLESIAIKVRESTDLSPREQSIFEGKTTEVEQKIKSYDEKVQEQQVQEQDEKGQTEKPAEEVQVSEEGAAQSQEDVVQEVDAENLEAGDTFDYKGEPFVVENKTDDGRIIVNADFDHMLSLDKEGQKAYRDKLKEIQESPLSVQSKVEEVPTAKKESYRFKKDNSGRVSETQQWANYVGAITEGIKQGNEYDDATMRDFDRYTKALDKTGGYKTVVDEATKVAEATQTPSEAKTEQKGTITPTEEESALKRPQRSEADFNEFVKDVVSDETNLTGLDLGLSGKQKAQAIRNIKEGKETVASKTLTDALRQMYDSGDVTFTGGIERGGARRTVPFEEFRQSLQRSAEREREIESEQMQGAIEAEDRKARRAQRFSEIDAELGNELENLAEALGITKRLTGEQRAKLAPTVARITKLLAEKYALKGQELVDEVIAYFKNKNIELDEELTQKVKDDAKGYESPPLREKGKQEKKQGQRDSDMPKVNRSKLQDGKKKEEEVRRGIDVTMEKYGGVYADIVKENPLFYTQRSSEGGIADAVDWLETHSEEEIYKSLSRAGKVHPDWQDRRQLYLAQLGKQLDQLVKEGKTAEAEAVLERYENVREALAKDYTTAGQTGQRGAVWKKLSNDVVAWNISNSIDKYNKARVPESDYDKLKESGEEINEASKEFGKGLVDEQSVIDAINKVVGKYDKGKITNKEKAKKIANKVRGIKSSNWGLTLAADPISSVGIGILDGALEVTARTIETTGNIADAIQKGIKFIKESEWYSSLNEDAKRKVERKYSYNTRSELGVEKLTKKELDSYLKRETRDLKKALTDLINEHWSTKNTLGIKLSERIVSDLGLSEADAKIVADAIQDIINEKIANNLTDFVDPDTVPKSKGAKKNFIQKMGDMMMRGDLDTKLFKDSFAESFGLKKDLTAEETNYILNLYKAVVATEDMGAYGDIVADLFAKEIDRLMPQTMVNRLLKTMVGLDYSNVLMGPATWKVNILSALTNAISSPITKTLDPVQWANAAKGSKSLSDFATLNPVIEGLLQYGWFSTGVVNRGTTDLVNILKNGDLRAMHKYISELQSTAKLRVPELERTLNGKYRFKPFKITLSNGKKVNINPTELSKYSGRMLAAQDALLNKGFETAIMAQQLTRKLTKEGVDKKEIYQQILRQVYGYGLTEKEKDSVDKKVDKEEETLKKYGIKYDKLQRNKRRLEVMQEMYLTLDEEELTDIKKTAKNQVFNDNRGGVVNAIMGSMSKMANKNLFTKLAISPHFMFFKIFGNIGDFVIDTVPIYGTARYMGWSPTTIIATGVKSYQDGATLNTAIKDAMFGKRYKVSELPFLTAQMGDKGSIAREKQRERAMTGNAMLLPAIAIISGLWAFGDDDDGEPWFDVSGARLDLKNYDERNNPADKMPPYIIKLGDWKFKYNTKPALMFAAGWLGAYRDMQRAGMEGETVTARMHMMGLAYLRALTTVSDLQIAGGFKDLNESMSRLFTTAQAIKSDPNAEELSTRKMISNFGKFMVKKQASMFTMWLPTRNNFLQQSWQYLDPNKVESKDIDAMMMYNLGIHKWTNLPAIDIFGFQMQSKPGYTNIYYDPLMEKTRPEEWERYVKLSEEKAMPQAPMNNRQMVINPVGAEEEYEYINPDDKEFWDFRYMAGQKFYEDISEYQDSEAWEVEKNRKKSSITGEKTVLQDNVSKYWSNAKTQTRDYLFTWRAFRKENPDLFDALYEADAVPSRISSVKIADIRDNEIYRDKDGNIVVADEISLGQQELFGFNARVMDKFINSMRLVPTNSPLYKDMAKSNWDMARELVELEITIEQ